MRHKALLLAATAGLLTWQTARAQYPEPLPETDYEVEMLLQQPQSSTKESRQGAAAWGDIMFQFHNSNDLVEIFNLRTKEKLQEIKFQRVAEHHCNNVNFGTDRYEKKDAFPLLYVSTERGSCILVYRVSYEGGQYALDKVQTIRIPEQADMGLYFPNSIIDGKKKALWLSGYSANSWNKHLPGNHLRYIRFDLPDPHAGDVKLEMKDAKQEFQDEWVYATQGVFIHKGKIYHSCGVRKDNIRLRVIDTKTGRIEKLYLPVSHGLDTEPEGAFLYEGMPTVATVDGRVFQIITGKKKKR